MPEAEASAGGCILVEKGGRMPIPIPDLKRAALLSMDFHASIVSAYVGEPDDFLSRVAGVQAAARERGLPVIHVGVGFRPGMPEISDRNVLFAAIKSSPQWLKMFSEGAGGLHPGIGPVGDEVVVTKHRVSAFAGTDLEMILRAGEIDTLILMGIASSGVVLSTLLHANALTRCLVTTTSSPTGPIPG